MSELDEGNIVEVLVDGLQLQQEQVLVAVVRQHVVINLGRYAKNEIICILMHVLGYKL